MTLTEYQDAVRVARAREVRASITAATSARHGMSVGEEGAKILSDELSELRAEYNDLMLIETAEQRAERMRQAEHKRVEAGRALIRSGRFRVVKGGQDGV